jgi:hypothetical protein
LRLVSLTSAALANRGRGAVRISEHPQIWEPCWITAVDASHRARHARGVRLRSERRGGTWRWTTSKTQMHAEHARLSAATEALRRDREDLQSRPVDVTEHEAVGRGYARTSRSFRCISTSGGTGFHADSVSARLVGP